jgi:hypothetical protein
MKKLAFCVCLLAIGGIGTMGTNACSSSSTSGSGSGGEDSGNDVSASSSSGSSSGGTDASGSSSGSSSGAGSSSGSSSGGGDAATITCTAEGDAGSFTCSNGGPGPDNGDACNTCIQTNGCSDWCTCSAESTEDDAGQLGGCLGFVDCVLVCVTGTDAAPPDDAGIPGCITLCSGGGDGGTYTAQQVTDGTNLIQTLASQCLTACQ